jgi:DNA polymerase-1
MMNVLVDADELIYKACAAAEYDLEMGANHILMSDFATTQRIFCDQEAKICDALGAGVVFMALSDRKNFRKEVLPTYKSNRKNSRKPLAYSRLRTWVVEEYRTIERPGLEADDILGIFHGDFDYIAASDKDLLTIPARVYSLYKDTITEVSPAQANYNWLTQTLVGDRVDGYAGCPGMGQVKAKTFLGRLGAIPGEISGSELPEAWAAIEEAFKDKGIDADSALAQARVARILRPTDWDEEKQKPILWSI